MLLKRLSITTIISVGILTTLSPSTSIKAANFSNGEITQVHQFQKEYANLSKKSYNQNNLYEVTPKLGQNFNAGKLQKDYISDQLSYINYYRSLFGLQPITDDKLANDSAQTTAAVMASINANPFVNQHGLPNEKRPNYINKGTWKLAQDTSETSNLNFNVNNQSAGDVITDLLTDHYNLTGSDTGHRAWLLSTRLSTTGIGAAYGSNGYRYSVQKVLNVDDLFKPASKATVVYPSVGVFPVELSKGKNVAWSIYLSDKIFTGVPKVTITDKDTKKTYTAKNVTNYSNSGFGNFKTVITYFPGKTPIVAGHQYQVKIGNLYKYTFKLFKQNTSLKTESVEEKATTYQRASEQQNPHGNSAFSNQSSKLWASFNPINEQTKIYQYFDSLKKNQWNNNFFIKRFLKNIPIHFQ
ncbi:CAP domain-containing protein [Lactobacillus agrestimuris]|uniref:CAP domain-containing protein n=1 Tax=Lactobacillus agrestimuris TaxID=2941328 RepID=UPI0020436BD9|nr:CAP domain-containing protein [Lactobacillus agrestimuris]